MQRRWDIFCTIIDNYGDIGVCWRLARQLTHEHHQKVRLWVDDLVSFSRIAPAINPNIQHQVVQGVEICHWLQTFTKIEPAEVLIEAFACELPDGYVQSLLQQRKQSVWINLEYLSAESWVSQYHGLPSPHPSFPLTKTCFFPGFVQGTGGLLREKNVMIQKDAFNTATEQAFLQRNGLPERQSGEIRISLFCYDTAPVRKLVQVLSESSVPVLLIVPQGSIAERIAALFNHASSQTKKLIKQEQLTIQIIPFMEQTDYDRLLWSCDVNFVRGEDSFVRAQWASSPLVWNIYPQSEGVHWKKLDAFLKRYTAGLPLEMATAVREMWIFWNGGNDINSINYFAFREALTQHHESWRKQLLKQEDLASNLVQFVENRL